MSQKLGVSSSSFKATDMHEPTKQLQTSLESESMKDKENDVNVCDICGDAGQEDLLAICTRCIDGAEHTYCMQTMLDKLPDGDWLCEDCQFKEAFENEKNYKAELESGALDQSCLKEDAQNPISTTHCEAPSTKVGSLVSTEDIVENRRPKGSSLTVKGNDQNVENRRPQSSSITLNGQVENVDVDAATWEKASQRSSVSAETVCLHKSSLLSFINADSAALKPSSSEQSSEFQPTLNGQKGSLLKSSSFNKPYAKPKVKQLDVPLAENATGKIASKHTQKGGLTREMVKSVSFRTEKWSCTDTESVKEKQPVNLKQIKVSSMGRNIERSVLEREDSSLPDFHQAVDARISRGSFHEDNTGPSGYNRANSLHLSRGSTGASPNGLNLQDQMRCQIPKECFNSLKNTAIPVHCNGKMYIHEGRANSKISLKRHAACQYEFRHVAGVGRLNSSCNISEEFIVKSSKQVFPSIDLSHANTLRSSVIPALEFFWQGDFEVLRIGRFPEPCGGLQAHLSIYASGKVFEAAKKFPPYKVQLEEVSCPSSWSLHFHGNHAKEHNIALFFFAKDIESYRSNYCKLLENMLKSDLALKGNIDGVELLIFPSNKLPEKSQRWNRLLFLWGMFNSRKSRGLEVLPNDQDNPCKNTIDSRPLFEDLPSPPSEVSNYQEINTSWNFNKADKYATHMVVTPASSTGTENKIYIAQESVDSKSLFRTSVNEKNNSFRDLGRREESDSRANVGSNCIHVNLSEDIIMPAPAVPSNERQGTDCLMSEDAEQEKINNENDVLGDKSSVFLLNIESESKSSGSPSNIPLDLHANDKTNSSTYDEKEQKKIKFDGGYISFNAEESSGGTLMKTICFPTRLKDGICCTVRVPESSSTSETQFIPLYSSPMRHPQVNTETNAIHIEDDKSEPSAPNMELVLSGKKNSLDNTFPLLSSSVCGKSNPYAGDGEELPALLSLSLGFPSLEVDMMVESNSTTEQLVPMKSCVSTPNALGGYSGI